MDNKQDIRKEAIRQRSFNAGTADDVDTAFELFKKLYLQHNFKNIALYWPHNNEFDTSLLIEFVLKNCGYALLPRVQKDTKILSFHMWREGEKLQESDLKIKEPLEKAKTQKPDIVITPLVAFDRNGSRLGYGGGYYDATFTALKEEGRDFISVGLAYDTQLCLFPLPKEPHDVPLDMVITNSQVYNFREDAL